jgi:hypothetical protein
MTYLTKRLALLGLALSLAPLAAQARTDAPHMMPQYVTTATAQPCWATNFGFLPTTCKPSICIDVQKGFWPRPGDCAR